MSSKCNSSPSILDSSNSKKTIHFITGLEKQYPKPSWLKIKYAENAQSVHINELVKKYNLHSVCESAHCPNRSECWSSGTATFMVMGEICSRSCRFCSVKSSALPGELDQNEPRNLAEAISTLNLKYIVITSVARDDLEDDGASHIAQCIQEVKKKNPSLLIEVLVPDFKGKVKSLQTIIDAKPDVVSHNIETIERLTKKVRDRRANYVQSLEVLRQFSVLSNKKIITKSSIMLGLGEKENEVEKSLYDLKAAGVEIVTLGQYLRPTIGSRHLPVHEYIAPKQFKKYEKLAYSLGFTFVASGPLVRSSYKAAEPFIEKILVSRIK